MMMMMRIEMMMMRRRRRRIEMMMMMMMIEMQWIKTAFIAAATATNALYVLYELTQLVYLRSHLDVLYVAGA